MKLKTNYVCEEIPHSEYPRPSMVRESFVCLNGTWNFGKFPADEANCMPTGSILVPFSPEASLSGQKDGFVLSEGEKLVYERVFTVTDEIKDKRLLLHFGAVDQSCAVLVNSKNAGAHRGGYTPFELDITDLVRVGENILRVECTDTTEKSSGARGKQSQTPGGIWYTAQSGIWQSVWMEYVPIDYIKGITITTNAYEKTVCIDLDYGGSAQCSVYDGEKMISQAKFEEGRASISEDFELWSPENPKLYGLVIKTDSEDVVRSYFGVRTFEIKEDKKGKKRIFLNGKPYFMNGLLDQGYWPDGLLTPPCDKAMRDELELLKKMGFNMIRKHIKLEPQRWYYYCDLLGFAVWQDFVNGGGEYKFSHIAALPFLGFHHDDRDYQYFARTDEAGREEFTASVYETVNSLKNHTCIGVWVPFNEGWGQFDSHSFTKLVKKLDPTRVVDSVSGWHDQGKNKTEMKSLHTYYTRLKVPADERCVVLSEFGGYSLKTEGHVFNENKEFGYKKFKSEKELMEALEALYLKKLLPLISKGLSACVYTQVSDVEEEINGLVTYDRKVIKVDVYRMKAINEKISAEADKIL